MTQNANDVEIANQGFAAFRQDLNDVLEDIATLHSGDDAPSTTYANQFWYETDTDKLYIRNEDNDAWIEILTLDQANDHLATIGATITLDGTGNVGIGGSPDTIFHIKSSASADTISRVENTAGYASNLNLKATGNYSFTTYEGGTKTWIVGQRGLSGGLYSVYDADNTAHRLVIDGSGDVGIGTSSPSSNISGSATVLQIDDSNIASIALNNTGANTKFEIASSASDALLFTDNGTERCRIDSSGSVLVGTTDTSPYNNSANSSSDNGVVISQGRIWAARSGGSPIDVNRTTSDGDIIVLRKSGTAVGAISTISSTMYLGTGNCSLRFHDTSLNIRPVYSTGLNRDNAIDLGTSSARFDDIYATNGTIQTSDQNEKQQIASLTAAEVTAAKAISALFKTFKWNDSVTENGDNARTHTGVIAQDVQQAMTDAGLDAGDYAFFISATWWETSTDVPAVAAVAEVLDSDGNVVTEAVEAVDAYTRVETYDTQADAPAGATQRTRLGIRYPELLAFVGAATEQRLADIETRLTALEAV